MMGGTAQTLAELSGAQVLAAIATTGQAVQMKFDAIALDVNPWADLCKVAERSTETENQGKELGDKMARLGATVTALEARSKAL
ncbi:hypothetical protein NDU88_001914 [Pleurodeles waltl]|uniref:Uncharacterized protein n=1 Tax=Pleurodeles waltl TaxID=8319 RepID=A0AAV7P8H5_PLEWA|nr:hypothetical protein NDU88_001914 [Pleurodeles waltl]